MTGFGDDARRVLAAAGLGRFESALERPAVRGELAARRQMGRAAYERANARRGVPWPVFASAHFLWEDPQD